MSSDLEPLETPAAAAQTNAAQADGPKKSKLPGWVTPRGLATAGAAAAIFVGGGGIGYAVGASGHDDGDRLPGRFDRADFDPGQGQFPGRPGGGRGQGFGQSQGQSQGESQGQSQGESQGQSQDSSGSGTAAS